MVYINLIAYISGSVEPGRKEGERKEGGKNGLSESFQRNSCIFQFFICI